MTRAKRVCREDGCGEPTTSIRCTACQRKYEAERRSAAQRGYGHAHRKATAKAKAKANATHCTRCGTPFTPDNPATGGHRVAVRHGGTSHAPFPRRKRRR
jgi:hypothetical protein